MGQRAQRGRVYRRCACSDGHERQLGPWCVRLLEEAGRGSWTYCVDLAPEYGKRKTRWRGGFASRAEAVREMRAVLDGELRGLYEDRRITVAGFLRQWLAVKMEEARSEHRRRLRGVRGTGPDPRTRPLPSPGPTPEAHRALDRRPAQGQARQGHHLPDRLHPSQRHQHRRAHLGAALQPRQALSRPGPALPSAPAGPRAGHHHPAPSTTPTG